MNQDASEADAVRAGQQPLPADERTPELILEQSLEQALEHSLALEQQRELEHHQLEQQMFDDVAELEEFAETLVRLRQPEQPDRPDGAAATASARRSAVDSADADPALRSW